MNEQKNFLDSRTWVAIALITVIWVGWQSYLGKKYKTQQPVPEVAVSGSAATEHTPTQQEAKPEKSATSAAEATAHMQKYEDDFWSFEVSSLGLGIKNIELKKYADRNNKRILISTPQDGGAFATQQFGRQEPLNFDFKIEGNEIIGVAHTEGATIEKKISINSSQYVFDVAMQIANAGNIKGVSQVFSDTISEQKSGFLSSSNNDYHSIFVAYGTASKRDRLKPDDHGPIGDKYDNVSLASLGEHYFAKAILDSSEIHPTFVAKYEKRDDVTLAMGALNYEFSPGTSETTLRFKAFAGPKDLELLQSIDPQFEKIIDFWVLGSIAKPLLMLLKWLHQWLNNWGIAIIFLTLIIRSAVLPLYLSSFRSMKAMQKIQPQMQAVREKYKDTPQQMNTEVMKLFRDNKVNPIGGCLPMFLQLPIFFALYRVLSQSIELYKAPFFFWIHDLSSKDPYFVLPLLMGASMFMQQKITPMTTADPAQQKVMLFMPIIFTGMMLSLPSGLALYILVSTVFGISQQLLFTKKDDKKLITVRPLKH